MKTTIRSEITTLSPMNTKRVFTGAKKFISPSVMIITLGLVGLILNVGDGFAVTYQSNVGVNFTFNPSISLSVSDNLNVDNLTPGNSSDSNIITVGVTTNSVAGYTLSATVGNKTDASTALTNTANSSYTFTNLATTPGVAANLSAFGDNKWGYSYCKDTVANCGSGGSATWISGSVGADGAAGSSVAGYAGLPLDNNDNASERGMGGITLINTTSAADSDSVQFKIGARAGSTQPAGTYTNVINFYAVSYAPPVSLYDAYLAAGKTMLNGHFTMQDMSSTICANTTLLETPLDVVDNRDGEVYKISKLADERCWLLDNLRLDLTNSDIIASLSSTNTNADNTTLNYLKNGGGTTSDQYPTAGLSGTNVTSGFAFNDVPQVNISYKNNVAPTTYGLGSGKIGVYYNFCAASAGSYCYTLEGIDIEETYYDIEGDICPTNWHLPNGKTGYNTADNIGEYGNLYAAYSGTASNSSNFQNNLSTPISGQFAHSTQGQLGSLGYFWSSTRYNTQYMYHLIVNSTATGASSYNGYCSRFGGASVRCIANN